MTNTTHQKPIGNDKSVTLLALPKERVVIDIKAEQDEVAKRIDELNADTKQVDQNKMNFPNGGTSTLFFYDAAGNFKSKVVVKIGADGLIPQSEKDNIIGGIENYWQPKDTNGDKLITESEVGGESYTPDTFAVLKRDGIQALSVAGNLPQDKLSERSKELSDMWDRFAQDGMLSKAEDKAIIDFMKSCGVELKITRETVPSVPPTAKPNNEPSLPSK